VEAQNDALTNLSVFEQLVQSGEASALVAPRQCVLASFKVEGFAVGVQKKLVRGQVFSATSVANPPRDPLEIATRTIKRELQFRDKRMERLRADDCEECGSILRDEGRRQSSAAV
jgi:hypothetical protein